MDKLIFGKGNAKLDMTIHTFSLPAGHSCPFALQCLSKANKTDGKIKDGKNTRFRCFAASQENLWPNVRTSRWHNYELLKTLKMHQMVSLINSSLPKTATIIRVHVSGDFFNSLYFRAWMEVARDNPDVLFYAYTKCLPYWLSYKHTVPGNFKLTASYGGKEDHLIELYKLKSAKVVYSEAEAAMLGLPIDHDDSHAYRGDKSFALLIHGTQPAGSVAAKAISLMKKKGVNYGYSK